MKLGICFDDSDDDSYFGISKYPRKYFEADIAVPKEVEQAAELTRNLWQEGANVPLAIHGLGYYGNGMIIRSGVVDETEKPFPFTRSEVMARVSFSGKLDGERVNFSELKRFHISVKGRRQFFPKDWEHIVSKNYSQEHRIGEDVRAYVPLVEEVNLSMGWLDGKFDDWDSVDEWGLERNKMDPKMFHKDRTNHATSKLERLQRENTSEFPGKDLAEALLRQEGRRETCFPLSPVIDLQEQPFGYPYKYANEALQRLFGESSAFNVPIVGYETIRDYVKGLPRMENYPKAADASVSRTEQPTVEECVAFMFGKVLPAVRDYVARKD
jgi:hypothetical protein